MYSVRCCVTLMVQLCRTVWAAAQMKDPPSVLCDNTQCVLTMYCSCSASQCMHDQVLEEPHSQLANGLKDTERACIAGYMHALLPALQFLQSGISDVSGVLENHQDDRQSDRFPL